jgi:hypothetical protein
MKKYYCANVPIPMDEDMYEKHKEECLVCMHRHTLLGRLFRFLFGA